LRDFKEFYKKHGTKLWFFGILGIILVLLAGSLLFPEVFWDKFLYRYFWGPVEVDATESGPILQSDGYQVDQGYTLISEITYGIVLILALYGIFRLFDRLKIKLDVQFVLSVAPYFFLGGTLRVLEDSELYKEPFVYFIISPFIYFLIGAVILVVIVYLITVERLKGPSTFKKVFYAGLLWIIFDIVYVVLFLFYKDSFSFMVHPVFPIIISVGMILFFNFHCRKNEFDPYFGVLLFGLFLLAFSAFMIMLWPNIEPWTEAYLTAQKRDGITTQPEGGLLVISITAAITFFTYLTAGFLKRKHGILKIYSNPVNLFIIFGQMFDAVATFVGVDYYGYAEKHPIPDFFFQTFGTSAVFLPIKFLLAIVVIYLIDISFKEDLKDYPNLKGLIKIIIIVLGLGPGTRDMLRLMMGV
jgi:uncharacterized membrane protein